MDKVLVMYDICKAIATDDLNSECCTFWEAQGGSMSTADQLSFCSKFQTEAAVAIECSDLAGVKVDDIMIQLCEAIPIASLMNGCTTY